MTVLPYGYSQYRFRALARQLTESFQPDAESLCTGVIDALTAASEVHSRDPSMYVLLWVCFVLLTRGFSKLDVQPCIYRPGCRRAFYVVTVHIQYRLQRRRGSEYV